MVGSSSAMRICALPKGRTEDSVSSSSKGGTLLQTFTGFGRALLVPTIRTLLYTNEQFANSQAGGRSHCFYRVRGFTAGAACALLARISEANPANRKGRAASRAATQSGKRPSSGQGLHWRS